MAEENNELVLESLIHYYGYCVNRATRNISKIQPGLAFSVKTKERVNKALAERERWKEKSKEVQALILKMTSN